LASVDGIDNVNYNDDNDDDNDGDDDDDDNNDDYDEDDDNNDDHDDDEDNVHSMMLRAIIITVCIDVGKTADATPPTTKATVPHA
jgi:ABC-type Zn2+ transport system substrate-binding protein/surface adhesin